MSSSKGLKKRYRCAFTLVELIVAISVSSILVAVTVQVYSLFRTSMTNDQVRADSMQNARVALDRVSRDLRQTLDVVTELPPNPSDSTIPQPHAIEFEDGHTNDLTYRSYYLSGTTLRMQRKRYYFPGAQAGVNVRWDTIGTGGALPIAATIGSAQDIADMVQGLDFYLEEGVFTVDMVTGDGVINFPTRTSVQGRNI